MYTLGAPARFGLRSFFSLKYRGEDSLLISPTSSSNPHSHATQDPGTLVPEVLLRPRLASGTLGPVGEEFDSCILAVLSQDRSVRSEGSDSGSRQRSQGHPFEEGLVRPEARESKRLSLIRKAAKEGCTQVSLALGIHCSYRHRLSP